MGALQDRKRNRGHTAQSPYGAKNRAACRFQANGGYTGGGGGDNGGDGSDPHDTVWKAYVVPVVDSWRALKAKITGKPA